jgi:hypothetical protein
MVKNDFLDFLLPTYIHTHLKIKSVILHWRTMIRSDFHSLRYRSGLPDFSCYMIPKPEKCTEWTQNAPNGRKIFEFSLKYSKWPYNMLTFSNLRSSKIYPNRDFWFENNHLATLIQRQDNMDSKIMNKTSCKTGLLFSLVAMLILWRNKRPFAMLSSSEDCSDD